MKDNKKSQSLMIATLTSSFGIFISKTLGLIYYSPLSSFAGEANMAFYSIAYTYYDLLLKISSAGIPFAIAALVSRYYAKEDYKTVLLVKKLGISIVMGLTFIVAIVFGLLSPSLARQSMGASASATDDFFNSSISSDSCTLFKCYKRLLSRIKKTRLIWLFSSFGTIC